MPIPEHATERGAVLVTGASTGIGEACAMHLDRLGFRVFAGVRKTEDGDRLRAAASARLTPIIIDVTDAASITQAATEIEALTGDHGLAGLVNNAGIAVAGPLEFIDLDRVRWQFEVNYFGQIAVTQAMLPLLRRAHGRVVNMSSMAGKVAPPFYGPYTSSKHALEAFSDSLRNELAPWGLHVAIIEPGAIDTPIWNKGLDLARETIAALPPAGRDLYAAQIESGLESVESAGARGIPVDTVARAVVHALTAKRPKTRYVVGRDARLSILAKRLLPDRLTDLFIRRSMGLPRPGSLRK